LLVGARNDEGKKWSEKNEIASSSTQGWLLAMTMVHGFRLAFGLKTGMTNKIDDFK